MEQANRERDIHQGHIHGLTKLQAGVEPWQEAHPIQQHSLATFHITDLQDHVRGAPLVALEDHT